MHAKKAGRAVLVGLVLALCLAGSAAAQGPMGMEGGPPRGGRWNMGMGGGHFSPENLGGFRILARALDLSEEQVEQVEEVLADARADLETLRESADAEEPEGFIEMFTSPDLSLADLEAMSEERSASREAVQDVVFQAIVDIHDILTDEQLAELAELVEQRRQGGMGMTGPGGGPFHGGPGGGPVPR